MIELAGREFSGVEEVAREAKTLLDTSPVGVPLPDEQRDFLVAVMRKYHAYGMLRLAEGVVSVEVSLGGGVARTRYFEFLRVRGGRVQMSLGRAFASVPTAKAVLTAFRYAIASQVSDFKAGYFERYADSTGKAPCSNTLAPMRVEDATVDHEAPKTFVNLVEEFVRLEGVDILSVRLREGRLADRRLRERWQEFHRERAELRVISHREHQRINDSENRRREDSVRSFRAANVR